MPIDDLMNDENQDEDEDDPNERRPQRLLDSRRQDDGELSDSDDEGDGRRDRISHRGRGQSSDSDSKLKYGINVGILASSSAPTHGAGPSGHTTAVRVLSSNAAADEEAGAGANGAPSGSEEARLEQLYETIAWPLGKTYGHPYDAFKLALTEPEKVFATLTPAPSAGAVSVVIGLS